ncbi:MAG: putative rane protein [Phenylobacterium sp.]|nr:putative rane protein [Phenylobacterium sp.]
MTMPDTETAATSAPILPEHIEQTIQAIARLHVEHRRGATGLQRIVDGLTRFFGRPRFAGLLTLFILGWIAFNSLPPRGSRAAFDPWPFSALQGLGTLTALFMTVFILITQRRDDQLSELREQLTLELGMLSEQKAAKIIELLEELRRDLPNVHNRVDREATALSRPADPEAVLEVLKENQAGAAAGGAAEAQTPAAPGAGAAGPPGNTDAGPPLVDVP